jgi:prepilin-type N-terminal cleavage/methylation domain-containing protein
MIAPVERCSPVSTGLFQSDVGRDRRIPPGGLSNPRQAWDPEPVEWARPRVYPRGFTLVEMLVVVASVAILSGSVLGLASGAHERAAGARAKVELAVLAQAVEAWHGDYGDYPAAADEAEFYEALTGRRGPQHRVLNPSGRTFIEPGGFVLRAADPATPGNVLLDPWGQPYHYVYFKRVLGGRLAPGYVLFSGGPDGCVKPDDPPASGAAAGVPDLTAPENADNLYSSQ